MFLSERGRLSGKLVANREATAKVALMAMGMRNKKIVESGIGFPVKEQFKIPK
jgi:hypothetical protein